MKISDLLKNKDTSFSYEFFPPKSAELEKILFESIDGLKNEGADFASVTFGAGGAFADKTLDYTKKIKTMLNAETMMHLTCVGFSKKALDDILFELKNAKIENVLALRGDIPKGAVNFPEGRDFAHASDLIKYIAKRNDFCIGAAGYPEMHPESKSKEHDIDMLKLKIDNGASFVVTQLFFDNDKFLKFRDDCAKVGVTSPMVAGIMPIVSASQIIKFTQMCNATLPKKLLDKITDKSDEDVIKIGVDYAVEQCKGLIEEGVNALHFYTLNRSHATKSVLKGIKKGS